MIATAATTLIANLSEHGTDPGSNRQLSCLQVCIRALNDLEKSHLPTRRVRRVIQQAMRILGLNEKVDGALPLEGGLEVLNQSVGLEAAETELAGVGNEAILMTDLEMDFSESFFSFHEFLPAGSQTNMLQSFESFMT